LLLPIVWGLVACLRAESVGTIAEIRSLDSRVGIGMLVLLAGFAGWSALRCIAWATTVKVHWQLERKTVTTGQCAIDRARDVRGVVP
jgi:hypothetical protein